MSHLLVSWLKVAGLAIGLLVTQKPIQLPALAATNTYVRRIDADKTLSHLSINSYPGHRDPASRDSLLLNYESIYFPCTAVITYSSGKTVRIKEIIRYGSGFETYQYYLKNDSLIFVEQKRISCDYQKQSNKTVYTDKDYQTHNRYYFANNTCVAVEEKGGKPFFAYGSYRPLAGQARTPSGFFLWQAARYVAVFDHPPKRH